MVRSAALALALVGASASAHEHPRFVWQSNTLGSTLMQLCGENWEFGRYDPCGSFITGVIDGLSLGGEICPTNETAGAHQMSVIAYRSVKDAPLRWGEPATFIIADALRGAYPCSSSN